MRTFDIIGLMVMWNINSMIDTKIREQRIMDPIRYNNDNVLKYLRMTSTGMCVVASLFTLYKYQ